MIQDDLAQMRQEMTAHIHNIRGSLDQEGRETEARHLQDMMSDPAFWDDPKRAERITKQLHVVSGPLEHYRDASRRFSAWEELVDLGLAENDLDILHEQMKEGQQLLKELRAFELTLILIGPYDQEDAIVTLHAGAGGTEAQDWVSMLLRMYLRWAEQHGLRATILDELPGEEAGLKSVTLEVRGDNAFGFLRPERGVHRLVRISPFDASGRRHTSFASVEVIPDLESDEDIEIRPDDLRVDTYRASGAGGQHINKTESAVRLTHLPTGIVVSCQTERSQHQNRDTAMKMLRGKLAELKEREWEQQMAAIRGVQADIGWGSQIRSYIFQPSAMVRDHRTRVENGNVQAVMNGELDPFIEAYLQGQARGALQPEDVSS
ncbi:MAG: peptide chain release factor 2 [Firmicutes bacterium]|nr:peptide chain release factor 2 [Bacillota bacterium]